MSPQAPPLKKVVRIWEGSTEDEIKQNELETTWLKNIEDGKVEQVKLAKRRKEELNLADESGITAMHKSIESWDKTNPPNAILKYLIDCGAYPEYGDRDAARPITWAIRSENAEGVEMLLALKNANGSRVVDLKQTIALTGNTLLHECAWYDRTDCARTILATGAFTKEDLNTAVNKAGQTVMHVACFQAAPPFIQLLTEYGGDIDAPCSNGGRFVARTPQQLAESLGKPANAAYLKELKVAITAIRFAARMRRRRQAQRKANTCLQLTLDFDFKMFTTDVEDALIVKLAKKASVKPEECIVLSKTAGSVILEIAITASNSDDALAKINRTSLESLSEALELNVLSRSVGPPGEANAKKTRRSTPDYKASPAMMRSGASA